MSWLLRYYQAYGHVSVANELQYRASLLIWQIATVLEPVVFLAVWSVVARSNGGSVGGFTPNDFAAYYLLQLIVTRLASTYVIWIFEERIRLGQFSAALLRPIHPIHIDVVEQATHNGIAFIVLLPAMAVLTLIFRPAFNPPLWGILAFLPAILLAFAVRFLVEWTVALAAFWTTRTVAVNQLYLVALFFLSGLVAPIALYPAPLQLLATYSPFRAMVTFPIDLALGRLTPAAALGGFAWQLCWLVLSLGLVGTIWRAGIRRYAGVGA